MSLATSALSASLRSRARIVAIPLSRPTRLGNAPSASAGPSGLTYYQFQLATKSKLKAKAPATNGEKESKSWLPEEGLSSWVQNKAASTWASFGKAEGGWKLKTFQAGERMVDRMDFEELALKSIDPSLGPSIKHPASNELDSDRREKDAQERIQIPLHYPPSVLTPELAVAELRKYVEHRIPVHRKGFYTWLIIAPLTAPFMIIPIIPNLPFFFCVWRSWSHYQAYQSSQYLKTLLDTNAIVPESSEVLDAIYRQFDPSRSSAPPKPQGLPRSTPITSSSSSTEPPSQGLLLTKTAVPAIVEKFELGTNATADLYRAVEQARVRNGGEKLT
ncbi:mitochondrial K+-H+ exchange-related-domain-containing protein, partial [Ephemerocybe angulata]